MLWIFLEKLLQPQDSLPINLSKGTKRENTISLPLLRRFLWLVLNNLPGRSQNHCLKMKLGEGQLELHCMEASLSGTMKGLVGTFAKRGSLKRQICKKCCMSGRKKKMNRHEAWTLLTAPAQTQALYVSLGESLIRLCGSVPQLYNGWHK